MPQSDPMKLLIIASRYPEMDTGDNKSTEFMQSYAVEWAKTGNQVLVYHAKPQFPGAVEAAIHVLTRIFRRSRALQEYRQMRMSGGNTEYSYRGVTVVRRMVRKRLPKTLCSRRSVARAAEELKEHLRNRKFRPDVIVSDFLNPAVLIANAAAQSLNIPTVAILHGVDFEYLRAPLTAKRAVSEVKRVCCIGFRSVPAKAEFERLYGPVRAFTIWYSGVSEQTLPRELLPRSSVRSFLTVGRLLRQKNFDVVIKAFDSANTARRYTLEIVGDGPERDRLEGLAAGLGSGELIRFTGKVTREEVLRRMRESDVFLLAPRHETFGMVYIEALSMGCLVIGAKGTGVDGILQNGVNGWLLEPGNERELLRLIRRIAGMSSAEIERISQNAYDTAASMTDSVLAARMLESLRQCIDRYPV